MALQGDDCAGSAGTISTRVRRHNLSMFAASRIGKVFFMANWTLNNYLTRPGGGGSGGLVRLCLRPGTEHVWPPLFAHNLAHCQS